MNATPAKRYRVTCRFTGSALEWAEARQGARTAQGRPMLRSEAQTFADMENPEFRAAGGNGNQCTTPAKLFQILETAPA
jgi:hypothetical protein